MGELRILDDAVQGVLTMLKVVKFPENDTNTMETGEAPMGSMKRKAYDACIEDMTKYCTMDDSAPKLFIFLATLVVSRSMIKYVLECSPPDQREFVKLYLRYLRYDFTNIVTVTNRI